MAKAKITERTESDFSALIEALSSLPPEALAGLIGGGAGEAPMEAGFDMERLGMRVPPEEFEPEPIDPPPPPPEPPPWPVGGPPPVGQPGPVAPTPGGGSALGRAGFSTLPPVQTGQFGIPVGGMMVNPEFFINMRNHFDAMASTDPRLRDEILLESGPASIRQRLLNTSATEPVAGLDAFLGRGAGVPVHMRTDGH
jgi:hypothetical protein